jgi:hypothetical protein
LHQTPLPVAKAWTTKAHRLLSGNNVAPAPAGMAGVTAIGYSAAS